MQKIRKQDFFFPSSRTPIDIVMRHLIWSSLFNAEPLFLEDGLNDEIAPERPLTSRGIFRLKYTLGGASR